MFVVEKIHDRFESINGEWYFDGEPLTESEANHLRLHYKDLCAKLRAPWENKDEWLDSLGRPNYSWRRDD